MDIGFSLLLAAFAAGVGALIGSALVMMFEHQGRFALTSQCGIALALALAVVAAPGLIWGFDVYSNMQLWTSWLGIAAIFSLGVAGTSLAIAYGAPARAQEYMDISSRMVPFAQKNFDEIDYDDDEIISVKDLDRALQQKNFKSAETQELLRFMRKHIHEIGHDVGTQYTGGQYNSSATVSVINRADLERYAARTAEKYAGWRK